MHHINGFPEDISNSEQGCSMKKLHKLQPQTAGPVWGLVFGVFMTAVGIGLWFYAEISHSSGRTDESVAVASMLIEVFSVVYAGREIHRKRNR